MKDGNLKDKIKKNERRGPESKQKNEVF